VAEIGRQHKISHTLINRRPKQKDWKRDLTHKVRREIASRLVSEDVSDGVSAEVSVVNARRAVDGAATGVVALVREHPKNIGNSREVVHGVVTELKEAAGNRQELGEVIEQESRGNAFQQVRRNPTTGNRQPANYPPITHLRFYTASTQRRPFGLQRSRTAGHPKTKNHVIVASAFHPIPEESSYRRHFLYAPVTDVGRRRIQGRLD
jgi:hypothetical protein